MKIYNITKGQLIVLWVFALILFLATFNNEGMNDFLALIIWILFFGVIFYTIGWRNCKKKQTIIYQSPKRKGVEEKKNKILELLKDKNKITNNDVEKLLNVSDASATNYLQELENEGKIKQVGKTGRSVFYEKING